MQTKDTPLCFNKRVRVEGMMKVTPNSTKHYKDKRWIWKTLCSRHPLQKGFLVLWRGLMPAMVLRFGISISVSQPQNLLVSAL